MASANEITQNVADLKAIRNIDDLAQFFPGRRNIIRRASLLMRVQAQQKKLQNRLNSIQHAAMDASDNEPLDERIGGEIADNGEEEEEVDEASAEISNGEEEEKENNEVAAENSNGEEENNEGSANLVRNRVSNDNLVWRDAERMFRSAIRMGEIVNNTHVDVGVFVNDCFPIFKIKVEEIVVKQPIKCYCVLELEFKSPRIGDEKLIIKWLHTNAMVIFETTNLSEWYDEHVKAYIDRRIDSFCENGSGWTVNRIIKLTVVMLNYETFKGGSFIPLPQQISNRHATVNVKNKDNKCFMWSILTALYKAQTNRNRVQNYLPYVNELNFGDPEFPIKVCDIDKFEKLNPTIAINLHKLRLINGEYIVNPCRQSKKDYMHDKNVKLINLLYLQNYYKDEGMDDVETAKLNYLEDPPVAHAEEIQAHYVLITCLETLLNSQISKNGHKLNLCEGCYCRFKSKEKLEEHIPYCRKMNGFTRVKMSRTKNNEDILYFKNHKHKLKIPYVIYADFETVLKPCTDSSNITHRHEAFSIGYYLKCSFDESQSVYRSYRMTREDQMSPATWFVRELSSIAERLETIYKTPKKMIITEEQQEEFEKATICCICNKFMNRNHETNYPVRDHDHFSRLYRGASHNKCNMQYVDSRTIPIVFHNLSNYDAHIFIEELNAQIKGGVKVLGANKERYITFSKYIHDSIINYRFIDSLKFLLASLDTVSSRLTEKPIVQKVFKEDDNYNSKDIDLLTSKGIFPYEYITDLSKLSETSLPPIESFYSSLSDSSVSEEDYAHAQKVWNTFDVKDIGQYSDIYLKTDVLLLADVFENFRDTCLKYYELDSAYYCSTPSFTWSAMLKYTDIKLELLTDVDMYIFIERGLRGGLTQASTRYAKSNCKYMREGYDPSKRDNYLMYFDVNNLYGYAMSEPLPYGDFYWVDEKEFDLTKSKSIKRFLEPTGEDGYILEVDLKYPKEIHDAHSDLPFCPEHKIPPGGKTKKLLATLHDKKNYVIHYSLLKEAINHGLILEKVHKILHFNQKPWLKKYIDLNTRRRQESTNEFDRNLFKLFNYACFGKFIENVRKRVQIHLVNHWDCRYGASYYIAQPNFHSIEYFNEDFAAIQMRNTSVYLDKPVYVGLSILDISKRLMYDFHYDIMRKAVSTPKNLKLLYKDTDSFIYSIYDDDIYEIMKDKIQHFDTSEYPNPNRFDMPRVNNKVIGLLKDEFKGSIFLEYVALRAKAYYCKYEQNAEADAELKKAKGVNRHVVKKTITGEHYK
ncbi:hypothetical protein TKK_0014531 [Trichogramma kaykai]